MLDFPMLSLDDIEIIEIQKLPQILIKDFQDIETIEMIDDTFNYSSEFENETIEELLINLYSYEEQTIPFKELQEKLIEFYCNEATEELLFVHIMAIGNITPEEILENIYEKITLEEYDEKFYLNVIKEFILSSYGNEYLNEIYNRN